MPFQLAVYCPATKRRAAVLSMCNTFFHLRNQPCRVLSFPNYQAVLEEDIVYDAYLLPLLTPPSGERLPEGLTLAKKLRANGVQSPIIFVAISPEWAYEAYRVDALQYLPMPLSPELLYPALARALPTARTPIFALTTAQGICGIPFSEIESVECTDHILHFHRLAHPSIRSLTLRMPLRTVLAPLLDDPRFLQPHRSFVINMTAVDRLGPSEFIMKSGASISVPRERYAAIKTAYLAFLKDSQQDETD